MCLDWVPEIPVTAVMVSYPPPLGSNTSLGQAQRWCREHRQTHVWVVNPQGQVVGGLSQQQVDLACDHGLGRDPLQRWMEPVRRVVAPEENVRVSDLVYRSGIPVVQGGRLLGVVYSEEVWRWLVGAPPKVIGMHLIPACYQEKLTVVWQAAASLGLELYVVGGVVRDLLLGRVGADPDIDGVVVSHGGANALTLARECQNRDPRVHKTTHETYQTATLTWPDGVVMDLATARTEFYPQPGSQPLVSASDLGQDLGRRDFSVNALAIRLTRADEGTLVDWHQGYEDLQKGQLRILHPHSFVEDPTRIFRACRFVVRLGFALEPWTAAMMHTTLASGIHDQRGGYRLRRECEYLLQTPTWRRAFQVLEEWGAWRCVDPRLHWQGEVMQRVVRVGQWATHFARRYRLSPQVRAQLRLEALLLDCPPEVATKMQLPENRLQRMAASQVLANSIQGWSPLPPPSQVDQRLASHSVETVLLAVAGCSRPLRALLYRYLHTWRLTKTLLTGDDLKVLGIPPGTQFGLILQGVRAAQLDQQIKNREEALAWVRHHWL
jgi:tRNA nucleotidyltransferase (CCA-adding enzyme)